MSVQDFGQEDGAIDHDAAVTSAVLSMLKIRRNC